MPWVKNEQSNQIYQLKVTLRGLRPAIWRRFYVRSDVTLDRLHDYIQVVMGWENYHLHQFEINGASYGQLHPDYDDMGMENERKYKLCDLVGKGDTFVYEYDFGDSWHHKIKVSKVLEAEKGVKYPICIAGERSCPPEDSGGTWGYEEMLEVLKDPDHEEYDDISEWIGEDFDPEKFDLERVNSYLKNS